MKNRRYIGHLCFALIAILFYLAKSYFPGSPDNAVVSGSFKVVAVIDGDTLVVRRNNHEETVRLIGIDAPETQDNQKARRDSERQGTSLKKINTSGKLSSRHLKQMLPVGSDIRLVYDISKFDKYGRTLAYVYNNQDTFLNLKMVADGFAYPIRVSPNTKFHADFTAASRFAQEAGLGLWKKD